MEWLIEIVIIFAVAAIVPAVLTLLYKRKVKEESNYAPDDIRTKMPKYLSVIFIVFFGIIFLLFAAVIVGASLDGEYEVALGIGVGEVFIAAFTAILILFLRTHYETADHEGITLVRCFGKKRKKIYYKDITYYSYALGYLGGLVAYDKFAIPLFRIAGTVVGVNLIAQKLQETEAMQVPMPKFGNFRGRNYGRVSAAVFPTAQMQATPEYKAYRKKQKNAGFIATFYTIGVLVSLICLMIALLSTPPPVFENYKVTGVVESYEYKGETLTIRLSDDESVYYLNSIIYDELDTSLKSKYLCLEPIVLYVGYTDKNGRKNISHIEFMGKTYLNESDAEQAEKDDYYLGIAIMRACGFIGAICIIAGTVFVVLRVKMKSPADKKE